MNNKFLYCFDESLSNKYISEGLLLLNKTNMNGKDAWVFAMNNKKLKFNSDEKGKYLLTNRLNF